MANTIIAPIIKSSNSLPSNATTRIDAYWSNGLYYIYAPYSTASGILQALYKSGDSGLVTSGLAWDISGVPEGKVITNVTLHFYTVKGEGKPVFYRYADFNEGSQIPSYLPSDGNKTGGFAVGWGSLDLGSPKGNSVIIGSELGTKTIYVWDGGGSFPVPVAENWQIYSHRSSVNQPYVVITYDDVPPEPPKSLYPSNIMLSARNIIRFAWMHDSKAGLGQNGFTLQYSTNGGVTWSAVTQTTSNQFYDMPANTLPTSGTATWRVKTKDTDGVESAYSTATFTLGITPQKTPIPIAPISQYVEESKITRFEWLFTGGDPGETQSKYDLQYSTDNGLTWDTISEVTANNYNEMARNTFATGTITWRVRTYNNWNEVSNYSDTKAFTVIGIPPAPLITTVSNTAMPLVSWQSAEQQTYELEIRTSGETVYTTGKIPKSDKTFKLPIFLENGPYIARLRVSNEYNFLSPWAEKAFTINIGKPDKANIEVFSRDYSALIKSDKPGLVYRDNVLIGEVTNSFEDFTGQNNKGYLYFVRVVEDESFSDSDAELGYCNFNGATLSQTTGDYVKLLYGMDSIPTEDLAFAVSATTMHFDGRKYPTIEYGGFVDKSIKLTYHIATLEEKNRIETMIENRKPFLLRLQKENIFGAITGYESTKNQFGYEITFSIVKTGEEYE